METGKSPQTPQGRKLIQGRLPFAIVDNKSASKLSGAKPKEDEETKTDTIKKIKSPESAPKEIELVNMVSDTSSSTKSEERTENSQEEEEDEEDDAEDEMDTSVCSKDSRDVLDSSALKKMTPKQVEREKKKEERRKEKEERERKKAEEKAEKERKKQEEKRLKEEEKETERKKKEEERKKREEEKEAEEKETERKKKEEERKKREEEKEAEKRKKEEERKKKEEEKEAEKRRKEEEKKRKEEEKEAERRKEEEKEKRKKERASQAFTSFFTQRKSSTKIDSDSAKDVVLAFPPFQIKESMKLAPLVRSTFDEIRKQHLDRFLESETTVSRSDMYKFKGYKGQTMGATWPLTKEVEVEVIDEDDAPVNKDDIIIAPATVGRMHAKLLQFGDNRRPAYWGTWRKQTKAVGPRRPFGKDESIFDYEIDSDDEWEEEVEPGESLTDSEGEGEEKEPADDYEVDNEFLVPHGYLSEEEGDKDEDERPLSPSAAKERLKMKEEQFERELKEKTCQIKPSLIGCCWNTDAEQEAQLLKVLNRYAAVVFGSTPICLTANDLACEGGDSPMVADDPSRSEKMAKRVVSESDVPVLIRLVHGNAYSRSVIVKEFQLYLERNRSEERIVPPKTKIVAKIGEIASWTKCSETGPMNGRTCWLVHPEFLERYQLSDLSVVNAWEFSTETKKRGRKPDDSKGDEGEETPPSKTARVSLMKKFIQPHTASPSTESISKADSPLPTETETVRTPSVPSTESTTQDAAAKPKSTPQAKKRIALISLSTSASKKPRNDSVATPLTNFLRKMGSKSEASTPVPPKSPKQDSMEVSTKDSDCPVLD